MDESATNTSYTDDTVIIDTGCANLSSVKFAFERIGANVTITDDAEKIRAAARVVLPGVGSAGAAMASLNEKNLVTLIQELTQPVLGVCLGMQMLSLLSKERGGKNQDCACLGVIPTTIDAITPQGLPLPHMGWNQITPTTHPLFNKVPAGSYVYFVHSYRAPICEFTLATCQYGESFSAAIGKDNFMGVQFHPEKSAAVGAQILRNFMAMREKKQEETV